MNAPDVRFDEASLLEEARERTGLSNFGDESFREPLAKLLKAIEHEARLTHTGNHALGKIRHAMLSLEIAGLLLAASDAPIVFLHLEKSYDDEH